MKRFCIIILFFLSITPRIYSQCSQIDSLYRVLRVAKADHDKINTLNILVEELLKIGKEAQAAFYAEQALKMAQKAKYEKGIADALSHIALLDYQDLENYQQAIDEYSKALKIYEELGDKQKIAKLNEVIGAFFFKQLSHESNEKAILYYEKALENYKALKDETKMASIYEILGEVYAKQGKDDEAIFSFQKAQDIRKKSGTVNPFNSRLLAKYKRIKKLEERIQTSNTFSVIVASGIIISILSVLSIYLFVQRNKARKLLKEKGLELHN